MISLRSPPLSSSPVLQYPLLRTPAMNRSDRSPEWLSLPSSSASPLRSRPPVPIRPCGPVDDGIDESEACAAGARTSLGHTPAKLRSLPIPNPRRPHRGGLLEDKFTIGRPDLKQPTQSECWQLHSPKPPLAHPPIRYYGWRRCPGVRDHGWSPQSTKFCSRSEALVP